MGGFIGDTLGGIGKAVSGVADDVLGLDPTGKGYWGYMNNVWGNDITDNLLGIDPNGNGMTGLWNAGTLAALTAGAGSALGGTAGLSDLFGGANAIGDGSATLSGSLADLNGATELASGSTGAVTTPASTSFATSAGIPSGELVSGTSGVAPNITTGAGMGNLLDVGTSGIGSTAASQGGIGTGFNLGTGVNTAGAYAPNIGSTAADIASTYSPSALQSLFTPSNIGKAMQIGRGIANYNETAANQRQLQNMANQQQFFQNQLRQSYENPQAYLNSAEAQATRSQAAQQLARAAAQSGRRSDVGAQLRDLNQMMLNKALPAYRQGLAQAYNPSAAFTAQRAAQAQSPMGNAMYSLNTLFGGSNPVISGSDISSAYDKLAGLFGY